MTDCKIDSGNAGRKSAIQVVAAGLLACGVLLAVAAGSSAAQAAGAPCLDRKVLSQQLDKKFSEGQVAVGLASSGQLIEVFSSVDGATWTIVMTRSDGTSCVMATGQAWHGQMKVAMGDPT